MRAVHFEVRNPRRSFSEALAHFGLALDLAESNAERTEHA